MSDPLHDYEGRLGRTFFDHQRGFLQAWLELDLLRACLYFPTGKGKTLTALAALGLRGLTRALVVTPPVQGPVWQAEGAKMGINVETISHAKFRQKKYRLDRNVPLIVDEFHLLGGAQGMGWKKLDRAARGYLAPLLILSATPQYNDAERVYSQSIAAAEIRSSARVAPRSVTVVAATSARMESKSSASDSTAPVQLMSPTVR